MEHRPRVLVVDPSSSDREAVRAALADRARVANLASTEEALAALAHEPAEIVLCALALPGAPAEMLLERIRREHPGTDFIVFGDDAAFEHAARMLKRGAGDYIHKPLRPAELLFVLERTMGRRRLLEENVHLRDAVKTLEVCRGLARCLEPGEVYPMALDLLLGTVSRSRGIALFQRNAIKISDGMAFRGLGESEAQRLHAFFVEDKEFDFAGFQEVEMLTSGPVHDALFEAGVEVSRVLSVPLRGNSSEAGVLWVLEDERPFDGGEFERAKIIAEHADLALRNAEQYGHAKERAFRDDVTDLHNARYLLEAAEHELRRAERYEAALSFVFLDLDRFKQVNDRHGHLVGSRTLRQLGQVLAHCVRQVDTVARYGGDEFTLLLVDTDLEGALQAAERIRAEVQKTNFEGGKFGHLRVTASLGVATYPQHGRTREDLIDAADKAMYRAKSLGRNRVCSASDPLSGEEPVTPSER